VTANVSGVAASANFGLTNLAGQPASIAASAGASQSAVINSVFAINLQATVKDNNGNPVNNVPVTFAAPPQTAASGTFGGSATVNTNATGVATAPAFTANSMAGGPYTVTASYAGAVTAANFDLVNTPAVISVVISPKRGAIEIGQSLSVSANVTNDVNGMGVTWSASGTTCSGTSCGTFVTLTPTSATYVAPSAAGVYSITATSNADYTKTDSNSIGVTDLPGVFTYHYNISRDGTNTHEYALTPSTVKTSTFGKLFSCPADGAIYAQPLWIPNLMVAGSSHNVVIVATQHESVYAFDADVTSCTILWHIDLIDSAHGGTSGETSVPSGGSGSLVGGGYGDIYPEIGITSTPVIDPNTNKLYVVSKSVNSKTQFFQRLHAIDLTTGNEVGTPQSIDASISVPGTGASSVSGQVAFDPRNENQRSGLVLSNGIVYVAWSSHEDQDPYHGWIVGFSASTLAPLKSNEFNTTPNQVGKLSYSRGGIWMGGGALAVDATGNLFFITGNGTFDANTGGSNYGDSVVRLNTAGGFSVADYFTPSDQSMLDSNDTDFGSGGATILVDQPTGPVTHLLIGGGKEGNLFLLNRDNLGKYNKSKNNVIQTINLGSGIFSTPAFWQNNLYVAGTGPLVQYVLNPATGKFNSAAYSQSSTRYGFPGPSPSISSNGATNGIVWTLDNTLYCTQQSPGCGATVLHAYDATNLATELWNSSQAAGNRDQAGHAVKFTVPTVANGKVYVGTRGNDSSILGEVEVYGLLPN